MTIRNFILILSIAAGCLLSAQQLIHYFQLESYQFQGYFRTIGRNLIRAVLPGLILDVVLIVTASAAIAFLPDESMNAGSWIISGCMIAAGFAIHQMLKNQKAKKPLVYTPRVKRLYGCIFAVMTVILIILVLLSFREAEFPAGMRSIQPGTAILLFFPALLPIWVALGGLAAWPIEKGISGLYFRDAQRILRERQDLIKIGITGSWGKTSVKFILGSMLQEKYHTLITPSSFNTPMGVTKVIRTDLTPAHRVFVAEMGARHVGEIAELCRLVHPEYGVLTSVGPQHLDTFRTIERVTKTKYELMEAVPDDGVCFFADDGGICRGLYEKTGKKKVIAGFDPERDGVWVENISTGPEGSAFDLCTKERRIPCQTELLGKLNIQNIALSASVCMELGLSDEQIRRGIRKLKPVEHRLQLITRPGAHTVIDDAFNSNIVGARQAFHTLKEFSGRRIVITPGMVELGDQEESMNRQFGSEMAGCCDLAILVGKKRSEAIRQGLTEGGFEEDNIIVVGSLKEAGDWIRDNAGPGDVILFENDLPDNYDE